MAALLVVLFCPVRQFVALPGTSQGLVCHPDVHRARLVLRRNLKCPSHPVIPRRFSPQLSYASFATSDANPLKQRPRRSGLRLALRNRSFRRLLIGMNTPDDWRLWIPWTFAPALVATSMQSSSRTASSSTRAMYCLSSILGHLKRF